MNSSALSILFESAPGAILENNVLLRVSGDDLNALLAARWLRELKPAVEVICTSCGKPHHVSVERREFRGGLGAYCADGAGWIAIDPERLRRFTFEHERFVGALSKATGLSGKPEALVDGVCWRLGFPTIAHKQVAMVAAREMNDPRAVMETAMALRRRQGAGHGLILCGVRPIVDLGLFPRGFNVGILDALISFDARNGIAMDLEAAAFALGLRKRRGAHGAPVAHPKLIPYIENRLSSGEALKGASAEARQLLANPDPWATPGMPLPDLAALRMAVTRRQKTHG